MNVTVVGIGYIGLPTACLLVRAGHDVTGVDIDTSKIQSLKSGKVPFEETGLQKLLTAVLKTNRFHVASKIEASDVYIIAVPTPQEREKADLTFVKNALESIISVMHGGELIIIESTIYPGASKKELLALLLKSDKQFLLAHCPERAIPGRTIYEMTHNNRIIGGLTRQAAVKTKKLYASFVKGHIDITDITTAEYCKVMENTYRDVNIALANEYAKIAEEVGIDIWEAIRLANKHPRVHIHSPGPGVGGHCIPVDPWFFVGISKHAKLIHTARDINDGMPAYVVKKLEYYIKKHNIKKPKVGILGLAYKKNVGDIRESPTFAVIKLLQKKKISYVVNDPFVKEGTFGCAKLDELLHASNMILVMTDHDVYTNINFSKYKNLRCIYDTRQCLRGPYGHIPFYTLGVGKGI